MSSSGSQNHPRRGLLNKTAKAVKSLVANKYEARREEKDALVKCNRRGNITS